MSIVVGADFCQNEGPGSVTFDRLIADLTKNRFVGAWKNNPDQFSALAAGTYRFQCCIHPWMDTTVTIKPN